MFFNSYYSICYEDGKSNSVNRYVIFYFTILSFAIQLVSAFTAIQVK